MNTKLYDELKNTGCGNIASELSNALIGKVVINKIHVAAVAVVYNYLSKKSATGKLSAIDFKEVDIIQDYKDLESEHIDRILERYTDEQLLSFVLFDDGLNEYRSGNSTTPEGVCKLAAKILDIQSNDKVLDLCSGKGSFPVVASRECIDFHYEGVDLDSASNEIARLRSSILGLDSAFKLCDALEYRAKHKVDKIFSNYPYLMRTPALNIFKEQVSKNLGIDFSVLQRASSDWIFNTVVLEQLKEDGKAVVIMTNGSSWNNNDKEIRRYFLENGYIEAAISLPGKIFYDTAISTTLLVISKNNKSVRMIDASDLYLSERRNNVLTDEHIDRIISLLNNDSDISTVKALEDFRDNDYILNAERYLGIAPEVKNGVEFGTIITKITRGSQLKADELDELKSDDKTPYRYLMLSNIDKGLISFDEDGQYMSELPEKLEKYCIKNNSIVLSKIGMPFFKSAVAQVQEGTMLLANGNLFVIEIDQAKADPYYIQAFFASDAGVAMFKSIYTGAVIRSISIDKLKKIIIPLPSMKKQKKIADKYAATLNDVALLKSRLEKLSAELSRVYDEG